MKEKLLAALAETRLREDELVALCSEAAPDPSGRWRPQDHLMHLSFSRDQHARLIEAARTGGELPAKLEEGWQDTVYEETRDQHAADVIARAAQSWAMYEAAVRACTDDDLGMPHPYESSQKLVGGSPGDHLAAHVFWCHMEAGDEKAAEAILLWAQDLSSRASTDPQTHAVATYNLACLYARTGRPEGALPLLRESFDVSPGLKEWAHKDPDLDPIRNDPGLIQLLA